ncbi:hypothetical protein I2485_06940 [Nesterenkonia sp. E16_7]|uniref:glutamine amidotransferase-related protein n=1 Tax=unclassified Nesterenkonia TaxID=2629769 RepID=UPI001A922A4C|nr:MULTISPECIES: hypothetical protein [unclassified Nesterenkonia]MBO0596975.1 hypothetical protein [Nesterenkonia sp. E16_10]MBO0598387.1 hypothetical protein [Nesterenkonia sp. E16_7]
MSETSSAARILVVNSYDSFVYTLAGYPRELGSEATVIRNDNPSVDDAKRLAAEHDGVLLSPNPGTLRDAGASVKRLPWCAETEDPVLSV